MERYMNILFCQQLKISNQMLFADEVLQLLLLTHILIQMK